MALSCGNGTDSTIRCGTLRHMPMVASQEMHQRVECDRQADSGRFMGSTSNEGCTAYPDPRSVDPVPFGMTGAFALSLWFKANSNTLQGIDHSYIFSTGPPFSAGASASDTFFLPNQVHLFLPDVQQPSYGLLRSIFKDSNDTRVRECAWPARDMRRHAWRPCARRPPCARLPHTGTAACRLTTLPSPSLTRRRDVP